MAVALSDKAYVMKEASAFNPVVYRILDLERLCAGTDEFVTSLSFACDGKHLAAGISNGWVMLIDVETRTRVRSLKDVHDSKVGAVCWNMATLTTGFRDGTIVHSDTRYGIKKQQSESCFIPPLSVENLDLN